MILPLLSFWISSWIDHNMANFAETNQWLTSQGLGRLSMTLLEHDIMTMNDLRANLFSPEPCLAKWSAMVFPQRSDAVIKPRATSVSVACPLILVTA